MMNFDQNDMDDFEELDDFDEMCFGDERRVAFIKQDVCDGKDMWVIYGADGVKIAATDNRDFAFLVARQNDFTPYSVH